MTVLNDDVNQALSELCMTIQESSETMGELSDQCFECIKYIENMLDLSWSMYENG